MRKRPNGIELLDGDVTGTAARAVISDVKGMLPNIRFVFKTREIEWVVEMPLEEAGKFLQQGLNAFSASLPPSPRPARNSLFDQ